MKKILIAILFLISLVGFGQNVNYYIKNSGNNANTGLSDAQAWQTISKLDDVIFQADDSIFFNRGDTWKEKFGPLGDGTNGHNVVITAYGTGAKPILMGSDTLNGWSRDANWIAHARPNVWGKYEARLGTTFGRRLWINGIEQHKASSFPPTALKPWYWNASKDSVYVYSATNPGATYTSMEKGIALDYPIDLVGDNYFTVKNLDLRYGYVSVHLTSVKGIVIDSCILSGFNGLTIGITNAGVDWSEDGEIKNCEFNTNSLVTTGYTYNPEYTNDAIKIFGNARNWDIHHNTFRDWGHASIEMVDITASPFERIDSILFHDNFCTSPKLDYGGRLNIDYINGVGNKFYRNLVRNISISNQLNGEYLEFYYNVIDTVKSSVYDAGDAFGIIISGYYNTERPWNNKYYNNVIANCGDDAIRISHYAGRATKKNNEFINNIIYNPTDSAFNIFNEDSIYNHTFRNNLIYKAGYSTPLVYRGTDMSVATFNTSASHGDIISGNISTTPVFVTGTFQPQLTSPVVNAGLDVRKTTDYAENTLVGQPDIGAYEYLFAALPSTGLGFEPKLFKENVKDTLNINKSLRIKGVPVLATALELNNLDGSTGVTGSGQVVLNSAPSFDSSITIAGDTTVTPIIGRIVFQSSDTSFYGCRSVTWRKKWYKLHD